MAVARALANRPRAGAGGRADRGAGCGQCSAGARSDSQVVPRGNASLLLVSHDLDIARQLPRVLMLTEINLAVAAVGSGCIGLI